MIVLDSNFSNSVEIIAFIFFFAILVIFFIFVAKWKSPEARGQRGEHSVSNMLSRISDERGGYIVDNVIIPNGKRTAQIDHIYFANNGIFVIETKNYSGRIYGDEESTYWTQVLGYGNVKNKLYNPLKQNNTHIYALKKIIGLDVEMIPIVVFVKGNTRYIKSYNVYTLSEAKSYIKSLPNVYSDNGIYSWYSKIQFYKENPVVTEEEHIHQVKQKSYSVEQENKRRKRRRFVKKLFR